MTARCLFALPGSEHVAQSVAEQVGATLGLIDIERFPDGETYLRYQSDLKDRDVILLAGLDRPDDKISGLLFAAATARDLGAASVGLVAPYLPYMRQDAVFRPGEAVTSRHFAGLISAAVDWLVTIDPHLHRIATLADIYTIPCVALSAASLLGGWVREHVERPLIVGPDVESDQWVRPIAALAGAGHVIAVKQRRGPADVQIVLPDLARFQERQAVITDDVISSAHTMSETARLLIDAGFATPVCLAVHGVFAPGASESLTQAGVGRVLTTNTIAHGTNELDVSALLSSGVDRALSRD